MKQSLIMIILNEIVNLKEKTMKKILLFVLMVNFCFAQHPDLLNTDWEITKVEGEFRPDSWFPPPMPYQQVTKFSTTYPQLLSSFFNTVSADLTFSGENLFTVNNKACTLADYSGDNGEVNEFFGFLCEFFRPNQGYYYYITNNGDKKTLVIESGIFESIHFTSPKLATKDSNIFQYILAPNPVKDFLTIENKTGINVVSIFDVSGKLVYELRNKSAKILKIDMQSFKTGTYLVKLNNEKTFKVIKL